MITYKGVVVRRSVDGYGVDKLSPVTGLWSVFFLSALSPSENEELNIILEQEL